jgi:hypothetical protein
MIRPPPHRLPSSRRGLALIEVVLVSVMALVTLGSLFLASSANMHALQHGGTRTDLQARASRLMDRVLRAVHEADRDSLAGLPMAPVPLNAFTYDEPQSVSALDGAVTVATMRIQLEYEPGDPNDGVDNDGDELVDEGRVVLIRDFGQPGCAAAFASSWKASCPTAATTTATG